MFYKHFEQRNDQIRLVFPKGNSAGSEINSYEAGWDEDTNQDTRMMAGLHPVDGSVETWGTEDVAVWARWTGVMNEGVVRCGAQWKDLHRLNIPSKERTGTMPTWSQLFDPNRWGPLTELGKTRQATNPQDEGQGERFTLVMLTLTRPPQSSRFEHADGHARKPRMWCPGGQAKMS